MIASIRKFTLRTMATAFAAFILLTSVPIDALAQTSNPLKYDFGGKSLFVFPCINGIFVLGSPPKPASLMYVWGISALKQYGPPKGVMYAILGSSTQFQPCMWICGGFPCTPFWGQLVLPNAGSSLVPSTPTYMSV